MTNAWRSVARVVGRGFNTVSILLLPSRCFACRRSLGRHHHLGACADCWSALVPITQATCMRCALPLPAGAQTGGPAKRSCARCTITPLPLDEAVAAVVYDEPARRFLLHAKNGFRPEILKAMGRQLGAVMALSKLEERSDLIVAVPSSVRARLRRGFDPAREIARQIAVATGIPLATAALRPRLLAGPAAKSLDASARWAAAQRRFRAGRVALGKRVLLVDDVLTTGATVSACARLLRAAGAREVRAAVWARTPSPSGRL